MQKQKQELNKYERVLIENLKVELDGIEYKGLELVNQIEQNNKNGNYRLYNMATGGVGPEYSPIANLLAKLGIE